MSIRVASVSTRVALAFCLLLAFAGRSTADPEQMPPEGAAKGPADPSHSGPVKPGLDALLRTEAATNFRLGSFSFAPGNDEGRVLVRLRPSVGLTPSDNLSARAEGQWYAFHDDQDFSILSLYQGYVEGVLPGVKGVSLKAGRQELVYGSTFLLGADAFYDGLSFDALKLSLKPSEKTSIDLFGGRYVKKWAGDIAGNLYGIHAAVVTKETLTIDLYGFRDTGGAGATHVGGEHEVTYSVGTRLSGRIAKGVDFELEPVYQFGRKNRDGSSHNDISAFGGHADITIDPALGRYPGRLFLSFACGSGDRDPEEGTFREFHNPNNDTPLAGGMNVVGDLSGVVAGAFRASGLSIVTAGGGIDVTEKLNVSLDGHYFRAGKAPAGFSKEIGIETNLILTWKFRDDASAILSANRFLTGDFFRDAAGSGKDIDYVFAQLQATF